MKKTLLITLARWLLISLTLLLTVYLRDPHLRTFRLVLLGVALSAAGGAAYHLWRQRRHAKPLSRELRGFFAIALAAVGVVVVTEGVFHYRKYTVLHADPAELRTLGRHFMVGFTQPQAILPLIESGAVGGVFVSRRNIQGKSVAEIHAETAAWQMLRQQAGLPPLLIAADQEGGIVSRLSPPLKSLPPLSELADLPAPHREEKVRRYAATQGRGLRQMGINVNFSPVVDIKSTAPADFLDFHSLIARRAISTDAETVAQVALTYCQTLNRLGIMPTLKHFPGLGEARGDTHHFDAAVTATPAVLQQREWLPFRTVIAATDSFMMLSHARLPALDAQYPVSYSRAVVHDLIRRQWQHDGVLITDDFGMRPVYNGPEGIGQAAVLALNAGVDVVLISYDGGKYYPAMYAVLQAYRRGKLDRALLEKSRRRYEIEKIIRISST